MASRLNIRTINSLCEQIIKRYVQKYNRQRFTLLKENEQIAIIRNIYIELTGDKFPHDSDNATDYRSTQPSGENVQFCISQWNLIEYTAITSYPDHRAEVISIGIFCLWTKMFML